MPKLFARPRGAVDYELAALHQPHDDGTRSDFL
jgi:hypothetical protein